MFSTLTTQLRDEIARVISILMTHERLRKVLFESSTGNVASSQTITQSADPQAIAQTMDQVSPVYIPRNHKVEEALSAASDGDLGPLQRLLDVLAQPFDERPGLEPYAAPAPPSFGPYRTFCGT